LSRAARAQAAEALERLRGGALTLNLTPGALQAAEALERLRGGGRHRARLGALRRLAPHGPGSAPVPLLAQLAARVAERAPAPDLVHNTASLRCAPGRTHSLPAS